MRKFLLILCVLCYKNSFSQINEGFSDGDFTKDPEWVGNSAENNFVVNNGELQSNSNTANSNFYLVTANTKASNCTWQFDCTLKFATSGANYIDFYLTSNTSDLQAANIEGYFVRVGGTADEISLFKRNGSLASSVKIIDGTDGVVASSSNNKFRIKVSRTTEGLFTLAWDNIISGQQNQTEGTVTDNTFSNSSYSGFYVQQSTAGFFQKHFFDNIIVQDIVIDDKAPVLVNMETENRKVTLTFDEPVEEQSAKLITNYLLSPGGLQAALVTVNGNVVMLNFADDFSTQTYTLEISNIKDLNGNAILLPIVKSFDFKAPYLAKLNDIVINEIFADPSPQIDLPALEFIELWNTTTEDIPLKNFKYKDATTTYTFSSADTIKANEYLILCAKADTLEFKSFGKTLGLSPWPSLNNTSDHLNLRNQNGDLIFDVAYNDTWYRDVEKKNGGYSLELIDPKSLCKISQNYIASKAISGGTPGKENSVYLMNKTTNPLLFTAVNILDSVTLALNFNRGLDSLQASLNSHYDINNGVGVPQNVEVLGPDFSLVKIKYQKPLTRNLNYTIMVNGLTDCSGNILNQQDLTFKYSGLLAKNDVIINEILFNPRPEGVDFVEVYNRSDKTLDLKDLYISSLHPDKDSLINIKTISDKSILFEPGTYWVLTTNPDNIKAEYQTQSPNNFIEMASMPAFNDDKGVVVLLDKNKQRIDQLNYSDKMHFPLLIDAEGVSLERSFINEETNKIGNFRSATATVGYATPTYKNSQFVETEHTEEEFSLSSPTISPDNDGFEDIVTLNYQLKENNYVANVTIFNDRGQKVKKLVGNETLAAQGKWIWDGLNDDNTKVNPGVYIVYAEFFNTNAKVKKFKKTLVVASKLM